MPYQILDHTADIRMRVTGKTLQELFEAAVTGMTEILHPRVGEESVGGPILERAVTIQAQGFTTLLIDFLADVLTLANIHREAYFKVAFDELTPTSLKARLTGFRVKKFAEDIKGVTYHEAEVKKMTKASWETNIVFDI